MRISTQVGDITTVTQGIIVQQVNAQRAMNSGVAKAIRDKYPEVWKQYEAADLTMGSVLLCTPAPHSNLLIASIVGQQFYGLHGLKYTSYDALDQGFRELAKLTQGLLEINYPLIGAGLGGGSWPVIREIINHRLANEKHHLWVQPNNLEPS